MRLLFLVKRVEERELVLTSTHVGTSLYANPFRLSDYSALPPPRYSSDMRHEHRGDWPRNIFRKLISPSLRPSRTTTLRFNCRIHSLGDPRQWSAKTKSSSFRKYEPQKKKNILFIFLTTLPKYERVPRVPNSSSFPMQDNFSFSGACTVLRSHYEESHPFTFQKPSGYKIGGFLAFEPALLDKVHLSLNPSGRNLSWPEVKPSSLLRVYSYIRPV